MSEQMQDTILNADDDAVRVRPGAAREHADLRAAAVRGVPAAAVRRRSPLRLRPRGAELGPRLLRLLHVANDSGERNHGPLRFEIRKLLPSLKLSHKGN